MNLRCLQLLFICSLCACHSASKTKPVKVAVAVKSIKTDSVSAMTIKTASSKAFDSFRDISGYYEEVDDEQTEELNEGCGISVNIKRNTKGFSYYLKTSDRRYRGKITLVNISDDKYGIVFEGTKYAEYEGDLSQKTVDDNAKKTNSPVGVGGELQQDTITIQNYGNAMNYYVQIGGCQVKYLRLVRLQ